MKQIGTVASLALLLDESHAQPTRFRIESDTGADTRPKPILNQEYHSTKDSNNSPAWWIDWDDVKCTQACDGPPPCGGEPAFWMDVYSNQDECCTAFSGSFSSNPPGRCVEPTLRAEVEMLIDESERELIPKFLRLGFHDCVGGCDGCVDLGNPDNKGLLEPIEAIADIVDRFEEWYSRADIWAMATLVSADMSLVDERPDGLHFPMNHIGRIDCDGADAMGLGGPHVDMPNNDLTTHELLEFFSDEFGFSADETVTIMGAHAVAVATRENVGFGNIGKEEGWVFEAEEYILDNRYYYYDMLLGDEEEDPAGSSPMWELELVHNEGDIPSRYQWFHEKEGEEERPIMTNADMALVRDLSDHMVDDDDGNTGKVDCIFKEEEEGGSTRRRLRKETPVVCPVASQTIEKALEYKLDNTLFLYDFEAVLEKMVNNGYST